MPPHDSPHHQRQPQGPRTARKTKYALARVAAGRKYRDLVRMGFGNKTILAAENGRLPTHPLIRAAYLRAIGLDKP